MSGAHPLRISAMCDWERRTLAEADLNVFVSEAMHDFYRGRYRPQRRPVCHRAVLRGRRSVPARESWFGAGGSPFEGADHRLPGHDGRLAMW